jgi:hypothetical protein
LDAANNEGIIQATFHCIRSWKIPQKISDKKDANITAEEIPSDESLSLLIFKELIKIR